MTRSFFSFILLFSAAVLAGGPTITVVYQKSKFPNKRSNSPATNDLKILSEPASDNDPENCLVRIASSSRHKLSGCNAANVQNMDDSYFYYIQKFNPNNPNDHYVLRSSADEKCTLIGYLDINKNPRRRSVQSQFRQPISLRFLCEQFCQGSFNHPFNLVLFYDRFLFRIMGLL